MPEQPQKPRGSPTTADLVAYLDRELDAESSRRIDDLLAADAAVRDEVQRLERAWDLLDELPRAAADERFTCSTIAMVAQAAAQDVVQGQAGASRRARREWLLAGLGLAAACLAGFLTFRLSLPDPNQQLLEDLPVLENLEAYSQVGDIEFLRMLRDEGLFDWEAEDAL